MIEWSAGSSTSTGHDKAAVPPTNISHPYFAEVLHADHRTALHYIKVPRIRISNLSSRSAHLLVT